MAKVINLRRARKARARDQDRARGDATAARFGRSRAGRAADLAEAARLDRQLDHHQRDRGEDD